MGSGGQTPPGKRVEETEERRHPLQDSRMATHCIPHLSHTRPIDITDIRVHKLMNRYFTKSYLKTRNGHLRLETHNRIVRKMGEWMRVPFRDPRAGCGWESSAQCSIPGRQVRQRATAAITTNQQSPPLKNIRQE